MSFRTFLGAALVGAVCVAAGPALAADAPARNNCFLAADWSGWKSPDPNTIYLRVDINRVYRLDLASPSYQLSDPGVHLISRIRGSNWICSPLDMQLYVGDDHGIMREPLFVKSLTPLTPDQVKAIPAKYRP